MPCPKTLIPPPFLKRTKPEDPAKTALRKRELELLQGTWQVVAMETGGKPEKDSVKSEFIFKGRQLLYRENDRGTEAVSFLIDPTSHPKRLSLQIGDFFVPGIYSLEGDQLKLCTDTKQRPTELTTSPDSLRHLWTLKRTKP